MNSDKFIIGKKSVIFFWAIVLLALSSSLLADEKEDFQAAINQNSIEAFKMYLKKYPTNENACRELEKLLYERITSQATLELCRDYLDQYDFDLHKQEVLVKMEPFLFDETIRTHTIDSYFEYLEKYPDRYRDTEISERLDTLIFKTLGRNESFSSFERYLRLVPKRKESLIARMEPFMFEWAKLVNTVESYNKYLNRYPEGMHIKEIEEGIDPLLFKVAQNADWYSSYEEYIKKCPDGVNVQNARQRIDWLKSQKAVPEISFPEVLVQPGGRWSFGTVFREKAGTIGFKVTGSGFIYDVKGNRWGTHGGSINRGAVTVKAGGMAMDDYWCGNNGSHTFCNGYAKFTWTGEDAGGHPIKMDVKVRFEHTHCPGPNGE